MCRIYYSDEGFNCEWCNRKRNLIGAAPIIRCYGITPHFYYEQKKTGHRKLEALTNPEKSQTISRKKCRNGI